MGSSHEYFMERCLTLAKHGGRAVAPNPLVGALIVHGDRIIAEGFHHEYGGPHAEAVAIQAVRDLSVLPECTVYVSLEPCVHYGKTPPCAHLIVERGIRRVVVGCRDPYDAVAGRGIAFLREHGVEVVENVLSDTCITLNKRFITAHRLHRPFVVLKWAQTKDGYIARSDGSSKWISSEHSRRLVHQWRSEEMAILVGTRTIEIDDPELTVRHVSGKNPLRIVIDRSCRLSRNYKIFNGESETWVFNEIKEERIGNTTYIKVPSDRDSLPAILQELYRRSITSLFVEGGAALLKSFIELGLWDDARVFIGDSHFHSGTTAPQLDMLNYTEQRSDVDQLRLYTHPLLASRLGIASESPSKDSC